MLFVLTDMNYIHLSRSNSPYTQSMSVKGHQPGEHAWDLHLPRCRSTDYMFYTIALPSYSSISLHLVEASPFLT